MYHECPINFYADKFGVPQSHIILIDDVLNEPVEENNLSTKGEIVAHYLHKLPLTPLTETEQEQIKCLTPSPEYYCITSAAIVLRRLWKFPIKLPDVPKKRAPGPYMDNWEIRAFITSLVGGDFNLANGTHLLFVIGYIHNCMHVGPQIDLPIILDEDPGLIC